jgi:hypothetical protein
VRMSTRPVASENVGRGQVTFETVGVGHLEPNPLPKARCRAVIWRVTAGSGKIQGATEYITSNFTVPVTGEVVDNQYIRMVLP